VFGIWLGALVLPGSGTACGPTASVCTDCLAVQGIYSGTISLGATSGCPVNGPRSGPITLVVAQAQVGSPPTPGSDLSITIADAAFKGILYSSSSGVASFTAIQDDTRKIGDASYRLRQHLTGAMTGQTISASYNGSLTDGLGSTCTASGQISGKRLP
jgi:hypothetical protein